MNHSLGEIEEAEVISEETIPLADQSWGENGFLSWIGEKADQWSEGNRGALVTEALILAGYAEHNERLREAYRNSEADIDRYFDQVDIERVINDNGPQVAQRVTEKASDLIKNNLPGFIAGAIVTAGTIITINKYRSSS